MRRAFPFFIAILASCGRSIPILSTQENRARDVVELIATDPGRYEIEREKALSAVGETSLVPLRLFDRILEEEEAARSADSRDDSIGRERARTQRARCLEALIQLGEPAAVQCVLEAAGGGARVALALDALSRIDDSFAIPAIRKGLAAGDAASRRGALRAVSPTGKRIVVIEEEVGALLSDSDWRVRREAAIVLGRQPRPLPDDPNATSWKWAPELTRLLDEPNLLVAEEAALTLGRRQIYNWIPSLIRFLERAEKARDPHAVFSAHASLREASSGADLAPVAAQWWRWFEQNQPIAPRPASGPALESQPKN